MQYFNLSTTLILNVLRTSVRRRKFFECQHKLAKCTMTVAFGIKKRLKRKLKSVSDTNCKRKENHLTNFIRNFVIYRYNIFNLYINSYIDY